MTSALSLTAANLLTPMVLFFALGLAAALARSSLSIPEAVAKAIALYLMAAIGFKGGASIADQSFDARMVATLLAGAAISALMPLIAFRMLIATTSLGRIDAAAIAAHYGSISIVTFVAASQSVALIGLDYEGYLVAVAAIMETPAILVALVLARNGASSGSSPNGALMREVLLNGSVVLLVGAFLIGWATGAEGMSIMSPLIGDPFKAVLCFFLLDMGLLAGRGLLQSGRELRLPVLMFGFYMPLIGGSIGLLAGWAVGLSTGGMAILATLAASASYIAVPAAMRLALPEARPALYLTLSLGVTFPFNLAIGIPIFISAATAFA